MSEKLQCGGPAYPVPLFVDHSGDYPEVRTPDDKGMDLLDYYAGQALVGLFSDGRVRGKYSENSGDRFKLAAEEAYGFARAMVAERQRLWELEYARRRAVKEAELAEYNRRLAAGEDVDD